MLNALQACSLSLFYIYRLLLLRMTRLIFICAKPFVASPSPNEISGPLERAEDLGGLQGPKAMS